MNIEQNKKTEGILSSLDGVQRASVPDFFYTRLKAKMEKGYEPDSSKSWLLRPAFAIVALVLIVAVNATAIFTRSTTPKENSIVETDNLQSIAAEYRLSESNSLYDLNVEK